jgi:hypothetical protein
VLNCDPTVAGCSSAGGPLPGGCERQILGSGNAGVCRRGCDIGEGTCPNAPDGSPESCYFTDVTKDLPGDKLKAPVCYPIATPGAADGAICTDPTSGGFFMDLCLPGSQCEIAAEASGAAADNKCHKLCYLGAFTPPDAGALFEDGGVAMGCPVGTTCTDVFGATGATSPSMPIGLCK